VVLPTRRWEAPEGFDLEQFLLGEREDYVKILLDDGKIGWVKKDDIF